jgi:GntR family transcriptional regulator, N-acetylglucosamine utilization regulator
MPRARSRSGDGSLYRQLVEPLLRRIETGELGAGVRLPTEAQLMQEHGVSRTTARRALDELRARGLVSREAGRGTFVLAPSIAVDLPYLQTVAGEISRTGHRAGVHVLERTERPAGEAVASRLGIGPRDPILHLRVLCTADDHPLVVRDSHLNLSRFPRLAGVRPGRSIVDTVHEHTGERVRGARHWVTAAGAAADVARLLGMRRTAPVLRLERVVYVGEQVAVETARIHLHPGRCRSYGEAAAPRPAEAPPGGDEEDEPGEPPSGR